MKTSTPKAVAPAWILVDAEGQSLGRLAARIAHVLRGKHKVTFSPHMLHADHVVVINAAKLAVPQKKLLQKTYMKHSGYLGSMRTTTLRQMMDKDPTKVIELTVTRMLPKNRLRPDMLKRLHVFAGAEHDHAAQQPKSTVLVKTRS